MSLRFEFGRRVFPETPLEVNGGDIILGPDFLGRLTRRAKTGDKTKEGQDIHNERGNLFWCHVIHPTKSDDDMLLCLDMAFDHGKTLFPMFFRNE